MRKIITLLSLLIVGGLYAQSLSLVSTNLKVYYDADVANSDITGPHVDIKNTAGSVNSYKVRWNNYNSSLCSVNYFCWDLCYIPGTPVSQGSLSIPSGMTNTLFSPHIYSSGNGLEGSCTVNYTFFNENDVNDTLNVTVEFIATKSLSLIDVEPSVSAVYPNPAKDILNVKFMNIESGEFQIINVIGQVVKTKNIENGINKLSIDVSSLESGVYFYSVLVKGQSIETKRLVISK